MKSKWPKYLFHMENCTRCDEPKPYLRPGASIKKSIIYLMEDRGMSEVQAKQFIKDGERGKCRRCLARWRYLVSKHLCISCGDRSPSKSDRRCMDCIVLAPQ